MSAPLPVFRFEHDPALDRALHEAAERVIASRWFVLGAEVKAFEAEFARFCGVDHCVGVANGTDALELALRAAGVAPGDHVVTAANAGFYTATALAAIGAHPRYVDVGTDLVMTAADVLPALSGARAVVVTHLYGRMAPMDWLEMARQAGVRVIEDCAQSHGAARGGRRAGSIGDVGCFSFYPTKNLGALGDGGAIITANAALATRVRELRQYGWTARYRVEIPGARNSRLDEMQAAFLRVKLARLSEFNAARRAIATRYCAALRDLPLTLPAWQDDEYVAHLFVVRCPDREALRADLAAAGIGTDVHYPVPDHLQPISASATVPRLPRTEAAAAEILTLPCFPGMTDADVDRVAGAIRAHYAEVRVP